VPHKSIETFEREMDAVGGIPELLWGSPIEFRRQDDPFRGFEPTERPDAPFENPRDVDFIVDTNHVRLRDPNALEDVLQYKFSERGPEGFTEHFYQATGVDLNEMRRDAEENRQWRSSRRADLVMRFGMEAYGTYLPWHAFARSSTPWGIYILPARIAEWVDDLIQNNKYLPSPLPSWDHLFFILFWVTYRHELFHWHVEAFALRHEVLVRQPIYRPYVERVRIPISINNPSQWWEEALAQAVVLDSRLVARRAGIRLATLRKFLVPEFKNRFGDGYRHFECNSIGGVREGHRILSAQVARVQLAHDPRATDLALIKDNYALDDRRVPGFLCFSAYDFMRFQLAPVKTRKFETFVRGKGGMFSPGPGDHRILTIDGHRLHVNAGRNPDEIDLASLKALAKTMGMSTYRLVQDIRSC
jgi:hypothetical protein